MGEVTTIRTPQIVAAEINSIKQQTMTLVLCNSIEIGRRLLEAKSLVGHGEWGTWLKSSVDYSQRTASNLMRIFEEYGANQTALFGDNSKSQTLANLNYSQAVALLGVAEEDREDFVKDNDLENLSVRQLQEVIKERDKAIKDNKDLNTKLIVTQNTVKSVTDDLEKSKKQSQSEVDLLTDMLAAANKKGSSSKKIQQIEEELRAAQQQVQDLTAKINEPITVEPVVVEKVPEEVELELESLRSINKLLEEKVAQSNNLTVKFKIYFEGIKDGFRNLLESLAEIEEVDSETHEKYKKAVAGLIGKMSEKL